MIKYYYIKISYCGGHGIDSLRYATAQWQLYYCKPTVIAPARKCLINIYYYYKHRLKEHNNMLHYNLWLINTSSIFVHQNSQNIILLRRIKEKCILPF